mmetsp:Transcript_6513/g.10320  ORF Transcript_6513/g.10320 Transcript_6513/m.10320 type:complete len:94 (+) Transcript_6513:787-1068(+)
MIPTQHHCKMHFNGLGSWVDDYSFAFCPSTLQTPAPQVAWHGPFVMNTQQQIRQTIQDYQQGKFGIIKGHEGRDKKRAEARENISRRLAKELR